MNDNPNSASSDSAPQGNGAGVEGDAYRALQQSPDPARLAELLHKRLSKFVALVAEVLTKGDAEDVHDLRVWSRRLQQVIAALFPNPAHQKIRAFVKAVRRARKLCGGWRNCDVVLETIDQKRKRASSAPRRRAWELVRESVLEIREREISRARRKLAKLDLMSYVSELKISDQVSQDGSTSPWQYLSSALETAFSRWQSSLSQALDDPQTETIHAFRIDTKRVRYCVEFARDLEMADPSDSLDWLKTLQDGLGRWHDRGELQAMIARTLERPGLVLDEIDAAMELAREIQKQRKLASREIEELLTTTTAAPERARMETFVRSFSQVGRPSPTQAEHAETTPR